MDAVLLGVDEHSTSSLLRVSREHDAFLAIELRVASQFGDFNILMHKACNIRVLVWGMGRAESHD